MKILGNIKKYWMEINLKNNCIMEIDKNSIEIFGKTKKINK